MGNRYRQQVLRTLILGSALALVLGGPAFGQSASDASTPVLKEPMIQPAIDGIFEAFKTHPLVGLSDKHGLAQEMEFYEALIRDPRFARDVGNVVVEFGGAARQDVINRYTNGEAVPYTELRQVWTDTIGWLPTVQHLGYAHFFAQVRETNAKLPANERIRVWLGDPPIVWDEIKTREDIQNTDRDGHAAALIVENILSRSENALVIFGGGHFGRVSPEEQVLREAWAEADPENAQPADLSLQGLVERDYQDAFFIIQVYVGLEDEVCTDRFEQNLRNWTLPALATPILGTSLERDLRRCNKTRNVRFKFPPSMPQALQDFLRSQANDLLFRGDAILFLGEAAGLTTSPMFPDLYLDEEYRREISRHLEILFGAPLPAEYGREVTVTPRPFED